jgi:hypothetical protein
MKAESKLVSIAKAVGLMIFREIFVVLLGLMKCQNLL